MFRFLLVRFLIGILLVFFVGGMMALTVDVHDQVVLINPPAEIMNGQVRTTETTIIHYYNEGDESKQVVFVTCSDEKLRFSPEQTEVILEYLNYQETGCP